MRSAKWFVCPVGIAISKAIFGAHPEPYSNTFTNCSPSREPKIAIVSLRRTPLGFQVDQNFFTEVEKERGRLQHILYVSTVQLSPRPALEKYFVKQIKQILLVIVAIFGTYSRARGVRMLQYTRNSWENTVQSSGKHSTLAVSQARNFSMARNDTQFLSVSNAIFPEAAGNLLRVVSSGHQIDVVDEGALTVMLPVSGTVQVKYGRQEHNFGAHGVRSLGPSRRQTRVVPAQDSRFVAGVLKLSMASVAQLERQNGAAIAGRTDPLVSSSAVAGRSLLNLIDYILDDLDTEKSLLTSRKSGTLAWALVMEHLACLIDPYFGFEDTQPTVAKARVAQAEDYMRSHFGDPLTVPEIAAAVGISPRQLQNVFRAERGTSPWAFLTAIRLQEARSLLGQGSQAASVTGTLFSCGFTHMGRFSQLYAQTYGELPSQTLRSAQN